LISGFLVGLMVMPPAVQQKLLNDLYFVASFLLPNALFTIIAEPSSSLESATSRTLLLVGFTNLPS
jgi:hypothetical protein